MEEKGYQEKDCWEKGYWEIDDVDREGSVQSNHTSTRTHVTNLYTPCYLSDDVVRVGLMCINRPLNYIIPNLLLTD